MDIRGRIGFRILPSVRNISTDVIEAFGRVPSAAVADAQGKLSGVTRGRLRKISGAGGTVAGPALTVKSAPLDNLMVHKAIDLAQPGDVLVVDAGGDLSGAIVGELVTLTAQSRGIKGIVLDGAVRDLSMLTELPIAVYACGVSPLGPHKNGPGEINVPIACDGAAVLPGDLVLLDDDGVVFVRAGDCADVLKRAQAIVAHEEDRKENILEGNLERPWVEELLVKAGL